MKLYAAAADKSHHLSQMFKTINIHTPPSSLPPFPVNLLLFFLHCDPAPTMATPLTSFRPVSIRPNASASQRSGPNRRKTASANWWTPLFGWSSDPAEYINADPGQNASNKDPGSDPTRAGSRFALGCFTEEKAKQLRKKTLETSAFHDFMYHSAIASRLASDLSDK
nr:uncharacterized protein LOC103440693 [Malus domestica]